MRSAVLTPRRALLVAGSILAACAASAHGQPAFRSASTNGAANAAKVTVNRPAGVAAGDVLIGSISVRLGVRAKVVAPTGWRLVRRDRGHSSAPLTTLTYVRVAVVSEPTSYTWKYSTKAAGIATVASYSGVDILAPVRSHAGAPSVRRLPQRMVTGRVRPASGDLLVALYATSGTGGITQASAMTERVDRGVGRRAHALHTEVSDGPVISADPVAIAARSASPNVSNVGVLLALAPSAEPAPAAPKTVSATVNAAGPATKGDFLLASTATSLSVRQGAAATTSVSVSARSGFSGSVSFLVSGLPNGTTATFSPTTVKKSGTTTLTIATTAITAVGTFPLKLTATSGTIVRTLPMSLVVSSASVDPPPPPPPPPPAAGTVGALLPATLTESQGTTYYVAPTGSDLNPGTASAPWRTVQKALNTLAAGQIALVRAGTYTENLVMTRAGTSAAPITIRNYPGERPVITAATGKTDNMPLQLGSGAAYLRIHGLTLQGATGPSTANIYAWGSAHDIDLAFLEVRNSARQGFFSDKTTARIQIRSSNFHDNGGLGPVQRDHNIYVEGSGHLIASSLIRNAPNGYGVQIYPSSQNVMLVGNTITANGRNGVLIGSDGTTTTTGARIVGNIITANGEYGIASYWGGATGSNNVVSNNLVWGNTAGNLSVAGASVQATLNANPLFVNPSAGDFRLQATSPALGHNVWDYTPASDLTGAVRPQGTGPDLGAHEQ